MFSALAVAGQSAFAADADAAADAEQAQTRVPTPDRVVTLTLPVDGQPVTGSLISYTSLLFTIETDAGQRHRVLWNMVPAENVDRYWRYLESPDGDAAKLFELGDLLVRHSQGRDLAGKAFDEALALDPSLAEAVANAKAGRYADGTPRFVGQGDPERWGAQSAQSMADGVEALRRFSERAEQQLEAGLKLYESDRFMLLTDVDPEQVAPLAAKLTETYRAIAQLLGEDPDGNVFLGKCLVVLFDERVDYVRFQHVMHDTDARGTGGMCHGFGNGHAHIAVIERANERQTHHVIAHELVHAYLHRYRSPVAMPDWVNEGLAEHIAHQVEPPPGSSLLLKSRLALEGKQGLGDGFFDGDNLDAWQYDIAGALTGYLLERGAHAYPKFISQIKDGTAPDQALRNTYRMTPATLAQRFKRRLDRELNDKLGG